MATEQAGHSLARRVSRRSAVRVRAIGAASLVGAAQVPRAAAQGATPATGQGAGQPRPPLSDNPMWEAFGTHAPVVDYALKGPDAPAMLRWSLVQRGFWVNGVDSLYDYAVDMRRYELSPVARDIACPTFLSRVEDDPVADYAPDLYEAITAPKVLVPFTAAEGAGMHTEVLARTLYAQQMFDWLDETLGVVG